MIKFGFKLHNLLSPDEIHNTYFFSGTKFYHLLWFFANNCNVQAYPTLKRFWKKFWGCNQNHKISHLNYQRKVIHFPGHGLIIYIQRKIFTEG